MNTFKLRIAATVACAAITLGSAPSIAAAQDVILLADKVDRPLPDPVQRGWELTVRKVKPGVLFPGSTKEQRDAFLQALPDWSGAWTNASGNGTIFDTRTADPPDNGGVSAPGERHWPPYRPAYEKIYATFLERLDAGYISDTLTYCLPKGMPRVMANPYNYNFVVTPEKVLVINEDDSQVRQIFTDGRDHPLNIVPTWQGHATGYWDGDTLVVDTVGVRGPEIIQGIYDQITDRSGPTLSPVARFQERIRKVSPDLIENIIVVDDPIALEKPWVVKRMYRKGAGQHYTADLHCEEAQSTELGERNLMVNGVTQAILPTDEPGYFLRPDQVVPER